MSLSIFGIGALYNLGNYRSILVRLTHTSSVLCVDPEALLRPARNAVRIITISKHASLF